MSNGSQGPTTQQGLVKSSGPVTGGQVGGTVSSTGPLMTNPYLSVNYCHYCKGTHSILQSCPALTLKPVQIALYLCHNCNQIHQVGTNCPYPYPYPPLNMMAPQGQLATPTPEAPIEPDVYTRFSNEKKCPKCDAPNEKLKLKFCPGQEASYYVSTPSCVLRCERRDHLHATCERCSFENLFLALDAPENDDEGND